MHVIERYRRLNHDTLELQITMDDPKAYTKPWVNPPKLYKMEPGWEIGEWFCVVDESNTYDRVVRKPAGVAPKWKPASVLLPPRRVLKITRARCTPRSRGSLLQIHFFLTAVRSSVVRRAVLSFPALRACWG